MVVKTRVFGCFRRARRGRGDFEGDRGSFEVSGNGIRFVWYIRGTQDEEVLESALIHHMQAGFVAMDEGEGRSGGKFAEGGGNAAERVTLGLSGEAFVESIGFDGPETAKAPLGGSHFLDHAEFDGIGRVESLDVFLEKVLKALPGFALQHDAIGEEAVAEGILGRAAFPLGRNRT